tara:strand:+ start:24326 stop:24946 length:621 start_codon:yes stop_codon:yes gene_type:complete
MAATTAATTAALAKKVAGGAALSAVAPWALAAGVAAPVVASLVPTRAERDYRKRVKAEAERLGKARGGLSAGERQQLEAEGQQRLQAQMQQAQADISRMRDPVARQRAMSQLQRGAMGQRAAISSDVRQQDLDLYAKQLAQHMQDQYKVAQQSAARRQAALQTGLQAGAIAAGSGEKIGKGLADWEGAKTKSALDLAAARKKGLGV